MKGGKLLEEIISPILSIKFFLFNINSWVTNTYHGDPAFYVFQNYTFVGDSGKWKRKIDRKNPEK